MHTARMFSCKIFAFYNSDSIPTGTGGRPQPRAVSQTIRSFSCHADPAFRLRINSRQKQLSHIYGQKQGQCWCYCDLIATLQAHFVRPLWDFLAQMWCWMAHTSVTNHFFFFHSLMYICLVDIFWFTHHSQFPHLCSGGFTM